MNTCQGLDWLRALAVTLWFHTSPVSSVPDALSVFEDAFRGVSQFGPYAAPPHPAHTAAADGVYDVRSGFIFGRLARNPHFDIVTRRREYSRDRADFCQWR